jgi:hypothetical protein
VRANGTNILSILSTTVVLRELCKPLKPDKSRKIAAQPDNQEFLFSYTSSQIRNFLQAVTICAELKDAATFQKDDNTDY